MTDLLTHAGAELAGPDDRYRTYLWRVWDDRLPRLGWVMLNPSTADGVTDDPTIRPGAIPVTITLQRPEPEVRIVPVDPRTGRPTR